jgi:zinc protease
LAASIRRNVLEQLVAMILSERLESLGRGERITMRHPVDGLHVYELITTTPTPSAAQATLAHLLGTVEQVRQHGYTAAEIERARTWLADKVQRNYGGREAWTSRQYAAAYVQYARADRPIPPLSPALHSALTLATLRGPKPITLEEVNAVARERLGPNGRLLFLTIASGESTTGDSTTGETTGESMTGSTDDGDPHHSTAGATVAVPTAQALLVLADSVAAAPQPMYDADAVVARPLLAVSPTPGKVVQEKLLADVGVHEWTLANGARVILKPTEFDANELLLFARAPGGISLAPDSVYISALLATQVVGVSGFGSFSKHGLVTRLRQQGGSVKLTPFITALNQGVTASAAPRDAELLFRMLYLVFTAPRSDSVAVAKLQQSLKQRLATNGDSVGRVIRGVMTSQHPRGRALSLAMVDSLDIDEALAFYQARFADASNFTFYLVGAFDSDSIKPLVERYLGGLPATHANETWRDFGIRPRGGPGIITANNSSEVKSTLRFIFHGSMHFDQRTNLLLNSVGTILQQRLQQRLRTELHASYSVRVLTAPAQWPSAHYTLDVIFDAAPEQADSLSAAALAVIRTLKTNGPTDQELQELRSLYQRQVQTGVQSNEYWLRMLSDADWNHWPYDKIGVAAMNERLEVLTPRRVQQAARQFLNDQYIRVVFRPRAVTS